MKSYNKNRLGKVEKKIIRRYCTIYLGTGRKAIPVDALRGQVKGRGKVKQDIADPHFSRALNTLEAKGYIKLIKGDRVKPGKRYKIDKKILIQ